MPSCRPDGIVDGAAHLTVHPGGGPANTAVALSRLGTTARFAGRLSGGALGALCRAKLEESLVDLSASENAVEPATLAIARLDATGAASLRVLHRGHRRLGLDRRLAGPADRRPVPGLHPAGRRSTPARSRWPCSRPARSSRTCWPGPGPQMTVSIDPNLRTLLVPVASYRLWIDRWAGLADIVRLSEDDLDQLWPGWTPGAGRGAPARLRGAAGGGQPGWRRRVRLAARRAGPGADRADHAGRHRRRRRLVPRRAAALPGREPATSAAGWTP